jgi:heme A synthase
MTLSLSRFTKFSWGVLAYNVFVILFGAFVRATGSGAGCGAHWPLCNGVVIPRPQRIETVIEFTHRLTSGLTLILVVALVVWAWRKYPKGSLLRWSSAASIFFTITEALVGASLVLYGWVATNTSAARAVSVPVHLVNTFLLLASLAITAWWSTDGVPQRLHFRGLTGVLVVLGGLAILLLGASGAITALGDTLFPSTSLAEGMAQDFTPTAHFLVRMRIFHPAIAASAGIYLFLATLWVRRQVKEPRLEAITNALFGFYVLQIFLGFINIALLAPVWMQIVHLLVSNLVWITYVLMATIVLSRPIPFVAAERLPGLGNQEIHDRVDRVERV